MGLVKTVKTRSISRKSACLDDANNTIIIVNAVNIKTAATIRNNHLLHNFELINNANNKNATER